jgi:hypothetical protein
MTTKKQRQKRNAGSLHYGGKCAASGRDDSVLLIPKTNVTADVAERIEIFPLDLPEMLHNAANSG